MGDYLKFGGFVANSVPELVAVHGHMGTGVRFVQQDGGGLQVTGRLNLVWKMN